MMSGNKYVSISSLVLLIAGLFVRQFFVLFGNLLLIIGTAGYVIDLFFLRNRKNYSEIVGNRLKEKDLLRDETLSQAFKASPSLEYIFEEFSSIVVQFKRSIAEINKLCNVVSDTAG